jgi:hypothetical protein
MDKQYAVGTDMTEIVRAGRCNSFDRFTKVAKRHDEEKIIKMPGRVQTP